MTTDTTGIVVLDTHLCLGLLRTCDVGRLAVSITDHPDIFPTVGVLTGRTLERLIGT